MPTYVLQYFILICSTLAAMSVGLARVRRVEHRQLCRGFKAKDVALRQTSHIYVTSVLFKTSCTLFRFAKIIRFVSCGTTRPFFKNSCCINIFLFPQRNNNFFSLYLGLNCGWPRPASLQPISQTTWLKVILYCNYCTLTHTTPTY
jgi:hypothetical protein